MVRATKIFKANPHREAFAFGVEQTRGKQTLRALGFEGIEGLSEDELVVYSFSMDFPVRRTEILGRLMHDEHGFRLEFESKKALLLSRAIDPYSHRLKVQVFPDYPTTDREPQIKSNSMDIGRAPPHRVSDF